jgi:hypothetical protein
MEDHILSWSLLMICSLFVWLVAGADLFERKVLLACG